MNYVRQCRVLIQIIGETITAMKLAACPDWMQIFFDATTWRQIPFSAVMISLMGDEPGSFDPIIVSSCVIMWDETSERQVEGITDKVREPKGLMKAKESTIEASYYWEMYRSDACWKNVRTMKTMLGRLNSESAKLEALKENIRMRVIGFGWTQFAITWSSKGKKRSVVELTHHMKMIIKEEKKLTPPTDPAIQLPTRDELPVLGTTATQQLIDSNETAHIDEEQFRKEVEELRQQREDRGEGSIYSALQPLVCPEPDELVDKRIDVLYSFTLDSGEKVLRWCQGKVIALVADTSKPTVCVRWDAMPDVEGKEDVNEETQQVVPQRKFNKNDEGAWILDINVSVRNGE